MRWREFLRERLPRSAFPRAASERVKGLMNRARARAAEATRKVGSVASPEQCGPERKSSPEAPARDNRFTRADSHVHAVRFADAGWSGHAVRFADAGWSGQAGWESGLERLRRLGVSSLGLWQARLVGSELALSEALDRLEKAVGSAGDDVVRWRGAARKLAGAWQAHNLAIFDAWHAVFVRLEVAWRGACLEVREIPRQQAWMAASEAFGGVWRAEGEKIQAALSLERARLPEVFRETAEACCTGPARPDRVWLEAQGRVLEALCGAARRMEGAWHSAGEALRRSAREAIAGPEPAPEAVARGFGAAGGELEGAIEPGAAEVRKAWLDTMDHLVRYLERRS